MIENVLEPLGMTNSRFTWNDTLGVKLATSYNEDGTIAPHFFYAEQSTGTLYSTIEDFTKFLQAHLFENPVLKKETQELIKKNQLPEDFASWSPNIDQALGAKIYGITTSDENIIGHGGLGRWTVQNQVLLNPTTGDGLIVFSNGTFDYASILGDEWLFWKYGFINYGTQMNNLNRIIMILVIGYLVIISVFRLRGFLKRKKSG